MAWERDDWAFILVLPTLRDRAPRFKHSSVYKEMCIQQVYRYPHSAHIILNIVIIH